MTLAQQVEALGRSVLDSELPVRLELWDGSTAGPTDAPTLRVNHRRALRRLLYAPNELGFAQAYVTGEIDVPGDAADLDRAFRTVWRSPAAVRGVRASHLRHVVGVYGRARPPKRAAGGPRRSAGRVRPRPGVKDLGKLAALALRARAIGLPPKAPSSQAKVTGRLHTRSRDKEVIAHHYDLSNDFYRLILDETMAYSCAYYSDPDMGVDKAQLAKLDLICRKLGLQPGMRLLDVGCGWGSLSLHAAEHYGVDVLGVTISTQQHAHIVEQIARRGLEDRVQVRVQDYREVDEQAFDAVSSIEMGEHVGLENYPEYAATLHRHLKPGGHLLLQQMSRHADAAPGGGPFIEAFIAPDMHMRPLPQTLTFLESAGFELLETQNLREHYAKTIADWHRTFDDNYDEAVAMVGDEVARVWRLYLVGAGLSFEQGRMGVDQILAQRPAYDLAADSADLRPESTTWYGA